MSAQILWPAHWTKSKGYVNGVAIPIVRASSRDRPAGAPEHIVRLTWFVTSRFDSDTREVNLWPKSSD